MYIYNVNKMLFSHHYDECMRCSFLSQTVNKEPLPSPRMLQLPSYQRGDKTWANYIRVSQKSAPADGSAEAVKQSTGTEAEPPPLHDMVSARKGCMNRIMPPISYSWSGWESRWQAMKIFLSFHLPRRHSGEDLPSVKDITEQCLRDLHQED